MEIVHSVYRIPPPIVIPVVPATVTRTNPVTQVATTPAYKAPTPVVARPQVTTTVTQTTPKRGVVTRG